MLYEVITAPTEFRLARHLVDLLEKQTYPDTRVDPKGDIKPPYDITGWTLPMQMGVDVAMLTEDLDVETSYNFV